MKILVLCTGNSCRSQMAEGFLKSYSADLDVYSAGTRPEKQVNPFAVRAMSELDIDISSYVPDNVEKYLSMEFDYVITVCDNARQSCPMFTGKVRNRLHIGFEDPADATGTVEEQMDVYRKIRNEINIAFLKFYSDNIKQTDENS